MYVYSLKISRVKIFVECIKFLWITEVASYCIELYCRTNFLRLKFLWVATPKSTKIFTLKIFRLHGISMELAYYRSYSIKF